MTWRYDHRSRTRWRAMEKELLLLEYVLSSFFLGEACSSLKEKDRTLKHALRKTPLTY